MSHLPVFIFISPLSAARWFTMRNVTGVHQRSWPLFTCLRDVVCSWQVRAQVVCSSWRLHLRRYSLPLPINSCRIRCRQGPLWARSGSWHFCLDWLYDSRQILSSWRGLFESPWVNSAEMAVVPGPVVERFSVIEHIGTGHIPDYVSPFSGSLLFQWAEERLLK